MARFKGGLAMAAVVACAAFGAICGSSVATAATITQVALPEMRRHGYSARLATGTLAAGGTLGILIPPSVPLVIYAILTEQNIAKLFAAAMIPGLIAMARLHPRDRDLRAPGAGAGARDDARARRRLSARTFVGVMPIAVIFLIVFGGIYGGLFSPTEGAAVGAAATFVAALLKREMTWRKFAALLLQHGRGLGDDLPDLPRRRRHELGARADPGAQRAGRRSARAGLVAVGDRRRRSCCSTSSLGFFMDELSVMLLTIPIFFPVVMGMDFGMPQEHVAIWFGILVLMTVSFGLLSPPVGLNVYVVNGMAQRRADRRELPRRAAVPGRRHAAHAAAAVLFPAISLWLLQFFR